MRIDRQMQADILIKLLGIFPDYHNFGSDEDFNSDIKKLYANMHYLQEHGLITSGSVGEEHGASADKVHRFILNTRITVHGVDLLMNDDGRSAILNCVTA